jgi:hypothetical protein
VSRPAAVPLFSLRREWRRSWKAEPDTLVLLALLVLAIAGCALGRFLIGPRK